MSFLYLSEAKRGAVWQNEFARALPDMPFLTSVDQVDDFAAVRYLAAWTLPDGLIAKLPNLEVVFSVGAGVDQLDLSTVPPEVAVVRMIVPGIREMIREYVTMAVLSLHRQLPQYLQQQRAEDWRPIASQPAADVRIGVLGLGDLGTGVLSALAAFGYPLSGWSRTKKTLAGVRCFAGGTELDAFLSQADILICLLPLTQETEGLLNHDLFSRLPPSAGLVHVGRGRQLDHMALINALNSGQLSGAFVDVTDPEPLPRRHAFWQHPKLILTPHIAAHTDAMEGAAHVIANIQSHRCGGPLAGAIGRKTGY